jgi:superfamily I DNA/RNA helicase
MTAGPRSGNTSVLLWPTVNLLIHHGVKPDELFASMFAEKAARQLGTTLTPLLSYNERTSMHFTERSIHRQEGSAHEGNEPIADAKDDSADANRLPETEKNEPSPVLNRETKGRATTEDRGRM